MYTIFFIYLVDEKIQNNQFEWDMFYERDKCIKTLCLCLKYWALVTFREGFHKVK